MTAPRTPAAQLWRPATDVAVVVLLALLALVPLQPAYGEASFALAAVGGVAVGTAAAVLGARLRGGPIEVAAFALVGYFLFGGVFALRGSVIAGFLPSLRTLADLALGMVFSWKQLLTVSAPVAGFEQLLVVPFLAGLVVSVLAVSFALRLRQSRYGWTLLPPGVLLVFSIAFGTYQGLLPVACGAAMAVLGLGWSAWRSQRARTEAAQADLVAARQPAGGRQRVALAAVLVLVAGLAGAGAVQSPTAAWERTVLRDVLVPPLELHDYPSPLMSFRRYSNDPDDPVLFTVSGLPANTPIRLATMDLYDGMVYKVSGSGGAGAGVFNRVGQTITGAADGVPATVEVEIGALDGVWLPDAGYLSGISFGGVRSEELGAGLHYNRATGTGIVTAGLRSGDSYTFNTSLPVAPTPEQLQDARLADIETPTPQLVSDALVAVHAQEVDTAAAPIAQVQKVVSFLQTGYFSHGMAGDDVQSPSGHSNWRLTSLLGSQQMVGDQEQYAVAMALLVAQSGLPARVVMGFEPDPEDATGDLIEVTAKDVTAWVEIPVEGFGWVKFDPTPDEDRKPQQEVPEKRQKPVYDVPQPPPPPQEPVELPPAPPVEPEEPEEPGPDYSWLYQLLWIGGGSLGLLMLLLGPGLVMLAVKAHRRTRRRLAAGTPDRISGGWDELVDTAADDGLRVPAVATRREGAALLDQAYPEVGLVPLGARADAAVFGGAQVSQEEAAAYWVQVEATRRQMAGRAGMRQRLRRFFAPASVLRRGRR